MRRVWLRSADRTLTGDRTRRTVHSSPRLHQRPSRGVSYTHRRRVATRDCFYPFPRCGEEGRGGGGEGLGECVFSSVFMLSRCADSHGSWCACSCPSGFGGGCVCQHRSNLAFDPSPRLSTCWRTTGRLFLRGTRRCGPVVAHVGGMPLDGRIQVVMVLSRNRSARRQFAVAQRVFGDTLYQCTADERPVDVHGAAGVVGTRRLRPRCSPPAGPACSGTRKGRGLDPRRRELSRACRRAWRDAPACEGQDDGDLGRPEK